MAIDKELVHPLQGSKYPVVARPYTDNMVVKEKFFTKDEVVAMLTEIQLEIEELDSNHTMPDVWSNQASKEIWNTALKLIEEIIEVRISNLKGMIDGPNDGNIITNIDKFKEVFASLPVSLDAQKRLVIDDNNIPYGFWEQEYKKEEKK